MTMSLAFAVLAAGPDDSSTAGNTHTVIRPTARLRGRPAHCSTVLRAGWVMLLVQAMKEDGAEVVYKKEKE